MLYLSTKTVGCRSPVRQSPRILAISIQGHRQYTNSSSKHAKGHGKLHREGAVNRVRREVDAFGATSKQFDKSIQDLTAWRYFDHLGFGLDDCGSFLWHSTLFHSLKIALAAREPPDIELIRFIQTRRLPHEQQIPKLTGLARRCRQ